MAGRNGEVGAPKKKGLRDANLRSLNDKMAKNRKWNQTSRNTEFNCMCVTHLDALLQEQLRDALDALQFPRDLVSGREQRKVQAQKGLHMKST